MHTKVNLWAFTEEKPSVPRALQDGVKSSLDSGFGFLPVLSRALPCAGSSHRARGGHVEAGELEDG